MTQEIVVILEDTTPDIVVQLSDPTPDEVQVTVQETGWSAPGPQGDPGPIGPPGDGNTSALDAHVVSDAPHPVYDDGPSFLLLYQNAKV